MSQNIIIEPRNAITAIPLKAHIFCNLSMKSNLNSEDKNHEISDVIRQMSVTAHIFLRCISTCRGNAEPINYENKLLSFFFLLISLFLFHYCSTIFIMSLIKSSESPSMLKKQQIAAFQRYGDSFYLFICNYYITSMSNLFL